MIFLSRHLALSLLCVALISGADLAAAQGDVTAGGSPEAELARAEKVLGSAALGSLTPARLKEIRSILDLIVTEYPGSDLATHILLEDKVGKIDVEQLDHVLTAPAPKGGSKMTASGVVEAPNTTQGQNPCDQLTKIRAELKVKTEELAGMRGQLTNLQRVLSTSAGKDEDSQIATLGAQLNAALAQVAVEQKTHDKAPSKASNAAVNDAIAAALASAVTKGRAKNKLGNGTAQEGPPLTSAKKLGLTLAVQKCWYVDVGSAAADITVTLGFSLNPNGTVVSGSVHQISASQGSPDAQRGAYDAARRAVLVCGADGYKLPPDQYQQWKNVEITFNPEQMRSR